MEAIHVHNTSIYLVEYENVLKQPNKDKSTQICIDSIQLGQLTEINAKIFIRKIHSSHGHI